MKLDLKWTIIASVGLSLGYMIGAYLWTKTRTYMENRDLQKEADKSMEDFIESL